MLKTEMAAIARERYEKMERNQIADYYTNRIASKRKVRSKLIKVKFALGICTVLLLCCIPGIKSIALNNVSVNEFLPFNANTIAEYQKYEDVSSASDTGSTLRKISGYTMDHGATVIDENNGESWHIDSAPEYDNNTMVDLIFDTMGTNDIYDDEVVNVIPKQ